MGIQARIVSRKIFIMTIYELLRTQDVIGYDFSLFQDVSQAMIRMVYMAERFFTNGEKTQAQIGTMLDVEYLKPLIQQRSSSYQAVIAAVDNNSTSFHFAQMDPIDQAIFLGGGVEFLVHKTPVKVILNEMIEISKRYGDE